jgi:hypothetical protein
MNKQLNDLYEREIKNIEGSLYFGKPVDMDNPKEVGAMFYGLGLSEGSKRQMKQNEMDIRVLSGEIMNESGVVKAMDMKRNEWITYRWENITTHCGELTYLNCGMRPIEESIQAGQEFDEWVGNARHTLKSVTHEQPDTGQSGHKI